MSSGLARTDTRSRIQELEIVKRARELDRRKRVVSAGPWQGYTPDLPQKMLDLSYCKRMPTGLVAKPDPTGTGGEVLTVDDGFKRCPESDPNGIATDGSLSANTSGTIVRIDLFPMRTTTGTRSGATDTKAIALTAGNDTNDGSFQVWQLDPSSNTWEDIAYGGTLATGGADQAGGINGDSATSVASMPDSCVHPAGAPGRAAAGAGPGISTAGAIAQPCFVFTNNVDPVYVYPDVTGGTTYEELTSQFTRFQAVSCESFGDRVYFLNTLEGGSRLPNRLRRTARGTADPIATSVGAGSLDFDEFSGQGLRCETLGDVLAVYFEDGTAFVRETGIATAPNQKQIIDQRRGLLGTHSVIRVGDNKHFGIFTDGWWLLDASARWTPVGISSVGGARVSKWVDAFYNTLDYGSRHRIQMGYDPVRNWVRISQPVLGTSVALLRVWIYDINSDRVWIDNYEAQPTCWGNINIPAETADTWTSVATAGDLWSDIFGTGPSALTTWAATTASFGLSRVVHGTDTTRIMEHSSNLITKDGTTTSFFYPGAVTDLGDPRSLKVADRSSVEYINVDNSNPMTLEVRNGRGVTFSSSDTMDEGGSVGAVETADGWHRGPGERLGLDVSGSAPVMIISVGIDYLEDGTENI